ncbi:glycosyltransferase family 2 protein [Nocardiopsis exhalans]|uniref:Glycosyltransferase family 2 protein n=1 Tax=Nocardiopsis exhalans TaxID=163604 RepID=A0ABY5DIZ9_9ACTN|nr:glycosyltransferase family A protein [Nocardiopsis exhalans]USY23186.1 glycosyltransferase family 2 protein [Nocardiopsis exhalans]
MEGALSDVLRSRGAGRLLVTHIGARAAEGLDRRRFGPGTEVLDLRQAAEHPCGDPFDHVLVVAATTADLRSAVRLADGLPSAANVVIVVKASAPHFDPPFPTPPGLGQWQGLLEARVRRLPDQGWSCALSFTDPVEVALVLASVARAVVGGRRGPTEPLLDGTGGAATAPSWEVLGRPGALTGNGTGPLASLSVAEVPGVDERVVNPMGFTRVSKSGVGRLVSRDGRWVLAAGGRTRWRVPDDGAVTDVDVAGLRDLRAVRVEWGRHSGPVAAVRVVAALAAAGVPLVSDRPPLWARSLGDELHDLLTGTNREELKDAQLREEHSVRLRRAALRSHGSYARGRGAFADPSVSVVLCTRRPEMVGFALRQVARQRGVDVEVVLALHGFDTDAPGVAEAVGAYRALGRELVVWRPDADMVFGSVLNGAIGRASGFLVAKMDDDDWYGPEHLSDLVLARRYSGADLVGCATEYHYLEPLDVTVRRFVPSERFARHVTGAGLMTDRSLLEEVGGFRPLGLGEDGALLEDARRVGGFIYRSHGLGCLIRRRRRGHTWQEAPGYFLKEPQQQWSGWRPSALLESDPEDEPTSRPALTTYRSQ